MNDWNMRASTQRSPCPRPKPPGIPRVPCPANRRVHMPPAINLATNKNNRRQLTQCLLENPEHPRRPPPTQWIHTNAAQAHTSNTRTANKQKEPWAQGYTSLAEKQTLKQGSSTFIPIHRTHLSHLQRPECTSRSTEMAICTVELRLC